MLINFLYEIFDTLFFRKKRYDKIIKIMNQRESEEKERLSEMTITYVENEDL